jgi:hypothetical protein
MTGDEVPIREHFAQRWEDHLRQHEAEEVARGAALAAVEKGTAAALASSEKAVDKAEEAQRLRNEAGNEVRGQLADQAARFVTRVEHDATVGAVRSELLAEIKAISQAQQTERTRGDTNAGRGIGQAALVTAIVSGFVVAGAVVGIIVNLGRVAP